MLTVLQNADRILRGQPLLLDRANAARDMTRLAGLVVLFGVFYGAVMGTFSATTWERAIQIVYSAVKVPMLLLVTFAIALPSFFVINTIVGTRKDFREALEALITTQAALTIVLASLAPFTAMWYCSTSDYGSSVLFNGAIFGAASFTAQAILRRLYRPLIARNPRHRIMLRAWLMLYVFIGIQLGWVLRPFVGSPISEPRFFREGAFSNAYVYIGTLIWNTFFG